MVFLSWTGCQYFHFRSYFTIDNTFTGRAISQLTFRSWSHNAAKLGAHSGPLCNLESSVPAFCFDLLQCIEQPRLEMLRKERKRLKGKIKQCKQMETRALQRSWERVSGNMDWEVAEGRAGETDEGRRRNRLQSMQLDSY